MTDGYDCYQNALKALVEESIYTYKEMRPHLSLGMNTPNEVHEKSQQLYRVTPLTVDSYRLKKYTKENTGLIMLDGLKNQSYCLVK